MKKHLSITALTCSALLALNNPIKAEGWNTGDVYYCESESGAFVKEETNWEFNKWKPLKFKFKIEGVGEDLYIKFGKGGHFNSLVLDISKSDIAWSNHFLKGTNTSGTFILNHERFKYVFVDGGTAAMMTGTCDKF